MNLIPLEENLIQNHFECCDLYFSNRSEFELHYHMVEYEGAYDIYFKSDISYIDKSVDLLSIRHTPYGGVKKFLHLNVIDIYLKLDKKQDFNYNDVIYDTYEFLIPSQYTFKDKSEFLFYIENSIKIYIGILYTYNGTKYSLISSFNVFQVVRLDNLNMYLK